MAAEEDQRNGRVELQVHGDVGLPRAGFPLTRSRQLS